MEDSFSEEEYIKTKNGNVISKSDVGYYTEQYNSFLSKTSKKDVTYKDFIKNHLEIIPVEDNKDTKPEPKLYPNLATQAPLVEESHTRSEAIEAKPLADFYKDGTTSRSSLNALKERKAKAKVAVRHSEEESVPQPTASEPIPVIENHFAMHKSTRGKKKVMAEVEPLEPVPQVQKKKDIPVIMNKSTRALRSRVQTPIIKAKDNCQTECSSEGKCCLSGEDCQVATNMMNQICKYSHSISEMMDYMKDKQSLQKLGSILSKMDTVNHSNASEHLGDLFEVDYIKANQSRLNRVKEISSEFVSLINKHIHNPSIASELSGLLKQVSKERIEANKKQVTSFFKEIFTRTLNASIHVYVSSAAGRLSAAEINGDAQDIANSFYNAVRGYSRAIQGISWTLAAFCYIIGNEYPEEMATMLGVNGTTDSPIQAKSSPLVNEKTIEVKIVRDRAVGRIKNDTISFSNYLIKKFDDKDSVKSKAEAFMARIMRMLEGKHEAKSVLLRLFAGCLMWLAKKLGDEAASELQELKTQFKRTNKKEKLSTSSSPSSSQLLGQQLVKDALEFFGKKNLQGEFSLLLPKNVQHDFVSHITSDPKLLRTLLKSHLIHDSLPSKSKSIKNLNSTDLFVSENKIESKGTFYEVSAIRKKLDQNGVILNIHDIDDVLE
jgi:hypothetical protein